MKCGKIIPQGDTHAKNCSNKGFKEHNSNFNFIHEEEPIFVTKNGYGDMVLMSMETYEKNLFLANVYGKLEEAKQDMKQGKYSSVEDAISRIRKNLGNAG